MGAKAIAAMDGRFSVSLDDVRKVAVRSFGIVLAPTFKRRRAEGISTEDIIAKLLKVVPEPEIPKYETRAKKEKAGKNNSPKRSWPKSSFMPMRRLFRANWADQQISR